MLAHNAAYLQEEGDDRLTKAEAKVQKAMQRTSSQRMNDSEHPRVAAFK